MFIFLAYYEILVYHYRENNQRRREYYMCEILLSIKPEFVNLIMCGQKKYEFRKKPCKQNVDKIIIYSTNPIMKVVGEAHVETVLIDKPENIWNITKEESGIERDFFDEYYRGRDQAVAYKLEHIVRYPEPKSLADYGISTAPQSFCYLGPQYSPH